MIGIDILLVAILVLSCVLGAMRGLIRELISLVAWIVGLWCAWHFAYIVEPELGGVLAGRPTSLWIARSLILLGILIVGGIASAIVGYLIRHSALSWLDRLLGVFFGLIRGLALVGLVAIAGSALKLTGGPAWHDARLSTYAESIGAALRTFVNDAGDPMKPPVA